MKYKVGDIIYYKTIIGLPRLYVVEETNTNSSVMRCVFNGNVKSKRAGKVWYHDCDRYIESRLATEEETRVLKLINDSSKSELKVDDLFTGIDRSFKRSIYRLVSKGLDYNVVDCLAYDGEIFERLCRSTWWSKDIDLFKKYRLATAQEIEETAFPEGIDVFKACGNAGMFTIGIHATGVTLMSEIEKLKQKGVLELFWREGIEKLKQAPNVTIQCDHEPMKYASFNMVYTICKKCDKTL